MSTVLAEKFKNQTFKLEEDIGAYLKFASELWEKESEIHEEISDINDIFQIILTDINVKIWIEIKEGKVDFDLKEHPNPTITIFFKEKLLLDIIYDRINPKVEYMAGNINIHGNISSAVILNNLLRYVQSKLLEK